MGRGALNETWIGLRIWLKDREVAEGKSGGREMEGDSATADNRDIQGGDS